MKMIGTRPEAVIKALRAATKNSDQDEDEESPDPNDDLSKSDIENHDAVQRSISGQHSHQGGVINYLNHPQIFNSDQFEIS